MGKVLLATVGTGPGVEEAVAFSVREANPELVVFLTTPQGSATVEKVVRMLGGSPPPQQTLTVVDAENVENCYRTACEAISNLRARGHGSAAITCDFTSGTKAMTAGLVLAALAEGCSVLSYVGGSRGADGRVVKGGETLLRLRPVQIWLDRYRQQLAEFFNRYQFGAGLEILEEMKILTGDQDVLAEVEQLRHLTLGYDAWDKFDHVKAQEHFARVRLGVVVRWKLDWEANRGFLARVCRAGNKFLDEVLCDLFLNAVRRREEGKYDDAVARLYRLIEMVAQATLEQHGIDTADVDPGRLPEAVRPTYESRRSPESGKIVLGLQEGYRILAATGDPLGLGFIGNARLRDLLASRNLSILAHGREPVGKEDCEALEAEARALLSRRVRDAERTLRSGAFAKLVIG
jgi:CRISPR-associated protein (TIGR02710 family)